MTKRELVRQRNVTEDEVSKEQIGSQSSSVCIEHLQSSFSYDSKRAPCIRFLHPSSHNYLVAIRKHAFVDIICILLYLCHQLFRNGASDLNDLIQAQKPNHTLPKLYANMSIIRTFENITYIKSKKLNSGNTCNHYRTFCFTVSYLYTQVKKKKK
jgi:hypothetical protein